MTRLLLAAFLVLALAYATLAAGGDRRLDRCRADVAVQRALLTEALVLAEYDGPDDEQAEARVADYVRRLKAHLQQ